MEELAFNVPDNKPFTMGFLRDVMRHLKSIPDDTPVFMSSDEEGNMFGKLWRIESTKEGIVLWPADAGNTPFDDSDFMNMED